MRSLRRSGKKKPFLMTQRMTIMKISQKGYLANCNNYRGITMLSVPGKILSRIILQSLIAALEEVRRDQQMDSGETVNAWTIESSQNSHWNGAHPYILHSYFIDIETFDSVSHSTLWKILRHYRIPEKFISKIQQLYYNSQVRVIHNGELTVPFIVKTSVHLGCILSSMLFLLVVDWS